MNGNRSEEIIFTLLQVYPQPRIELNFRNAFELLVAAILAAQCTDARVNQVTGQFFKKYPDAYRVVAEERQVIEEAIKSTGFYRSKAGSLIACCEKLVKDFGGLVPRSVEKMLLLPGVGRKTANMVASNAFGMSAITVDTHLKRVAARLGLTKSEDPEKIEHDLQKLVAEKHWTVFSQLMTLHGRYTCQARKPRCGECPIHALCPYGRIK